MAKNFLYIDSTTGFATEAASYEQTDFTSTSSGVASAGKPIKLDAGGKLDASLIDQTDIDHGSISGLADDDHAQYILVAGTRAFTGDQSMGTYKVTNLGVPASYAIDTASDDAVPMSLLASTTSGKGAKTIGINDANNYYAATNVEDALQEVYAAIPGTVSMTVGTGGVTKGDAVYISAANTILPLTTITGNQYVVGLAKATAAAAATVAIAGNDTVVSGVLTGATAGAKYYWNGTTASTTMPSAGNANVWQMGIAKNATDLYVEVEHLKKNA